MNLDGVPDVAWAFSTYDPVALASFGTAEVFSGADGSLLWQVSPGVLGDGFGYPVAAIGDINADGRNDVLVGARYADHPNGWIEAGRVYVLSGLDGSILLTVDGHGPGDQFGTALDGLGDIDSDGVPDLIVGAPKATIFGAGFAGGAWAHSGADGSMLQAHVGFSSGLSVGNAVAGAGDVDADGTPDMIVGSQFWGASTGRALVYSGATGLPLHTFTGDQSPEAHGFAVEGLPDINGDGHDDLVVGTPYVTTPGITYGGRTRVYSGATGSILYEIHGTVDNDLLGTITNMSLASLGDVDGDGKADLAIGYPFADPGGVEQAGAIDIHSGATGAYLLSIGGQAKFDGMGYSIGAAGDLNGNWLPDVVFGSNVYADVYDLGFGLVGDKTELSVGAGGTQALTLSAGAARAGDMYLMLGSGAGTTPGYTVDGMNLPLNVDSYLLYTLANPNSPSLAQSFGLLDAQGSAQTSFILPAGFAPSLAGAVIHHAAVVLGLGGPSPTVDYTSNPMPVTLTP